MAATVSTFISKGGQITTSGTCSSSFKRKLEIISTRFSTLSRFKHASIETLNGFTTEEGTPCFRPLTSKEVSAIQSLQDEINAELSVEENFIHLLTKKFITKQINMINDLTLESLNTNPLLCYALKFNNAEDFIKYNTYQAISRSIVTSMGYLVQDLLLYSNEYVYEGKNYEDGIKTKFDLVIDKLDEVKSFFEIKSGFNDLDKGQVKHYEEELDAVELQGNKAYIGITYGKKDAKTVTSGLLESYVKDWKEKTLVGKELWDYISGKENYYQTLINTINNTANVVLNNDSIVHKIDNKVILLLEDFHTNFSSIDDYYNSLW